MLEHAPIHVKQIFQQQQKDLGGKFKKYSRLELRIFRNLIYALQKIDNNSVTRLLLLREGYIIPHQHLEGFGETSFKLTLLEGAYGHILRHNNHQSPLLNFEVKTGERYGISVLKGYLIIEICFTPVYHFDI